MFAECDDGYFGINYCDFTCNCYDPDEVCDKVSGSCSSGCQAGFIGDDCQEGNYIDIYDIVMLIFMLIMLRRISKPLYLFAFNDSFLDYIKYLITHT